MMKNAEKDSSFIDRSELRPLVVNIHRYNLGQITEWIESNGVDYVAGGGSDKSVLIAAMIAGKPNLPFYCSPEIARMPLTKGQIQQVLVKAGVPIP